MKNIENKKLLQMLLFNMCEGPPKKLTPFWLVFKPFFGISPEIFAIVQKAPILHFWDPSIIVPLGK